MACWCCPDPSSSSSPSLMEEGRDERGIVDLTEKEGDEEEGGARKVRLNTPPPWWRDEGVSRRSSLAPGRLCLPCLLEGRLMSSERSPESPRVGEWEGQGWGPTSRVLSAVDYSATSTPPPIYNSREDL